MRIAPLKKAWLKAENAVLHGERLATLMSDLFRANIELGLPRSPPAPRLLAAAVPQVSSPCCGRPAPAVPEGRKPEDKSFTGQKRRRDIEAVPLHFLCGMGRRHPIAVRIDDQARQQARVLRKQPETNTQ